MSEKIPIVKEVDGKKRVFFYQLNETELKIYRELQWIEDLIDMRDLRFRLQNPIYFDKAVKRLSSLGYVSIVDIQTELLIIAN